MADYFGTAPRLVMETLRKGGTLDTVPELKIPPETDEADDSGIEFKPDWLPEPFNHVVQAWAESLEVDISAAAAALLGAVSIAVTGKLRVKVGDDYFEPVQLWFMVILPSGNRKSACLSKALRPIYSLQDDENHARSERRAPLENKLAFIKKQLNAQAGKQNYDEERVSELEQQRREIDEELKPLHYLKLIVDDTTSEATIKVLDENGGSTSLASAEGGVFETMNGRYSGGVPNLDIYLHGYDSERVAVNRAGGQSILLKRPSISMLYFVQPGTASGVLSSGVMKGRGFVGRTAFIKPRSMVGEHTYMSPRVPGDLTDAYNRKIQALMKLQTVEGDVRTIELTDSAHEMYVQHALELDVSQSKRHGGKLAYLEEAAPGWVSKHAGRTARLAGVIKMLDDSDVSRPVTKDHMERAINIAEWEIDHLEQSVDASDDAIIEKVARQILGVIARNKSGKYGVGEVFTQSPFTSSLSKGGLSRMDAQLRRTIINEAFDWLAKCGAVIPAPDMTQESKVRKWLANPILFLDTEG